jgi:hypothetical protein
MSLYELEIGWAASEHERRYLRWELLACEDVRGVFSTARADTLAVLFSGGRLRFLSWARSVKPEAPLTPTTTREGAFE